MNMEAPPPLIEVSKLSDYKGRECALLFLLVSFIHDIVNDNDLAIILFVRKCSYEIFMLCPRFQGIYTSSLHGCERGTVRNRKK